MDRLKFKVLTLGCRTNQYESQAYADQLLAAGHIRASEAETVDLCIINTCTVTETADLSGKSLVRRIVKENPGAKIVVTGCAAEKNEAVFSTISDSIRVIPNKDKEELLPLLFPEETWPEFAIRTFEAKTRAFVKIQDGCNSFCTYCIIPYVRGRSRSRRVDAILAEIRTLLANGYKEIVLTGINIGDFDGAPEEGENPVRLADLVRTVDQLEGLQRLRISSIDPDEVDEDLADAVVNGRTTCPSFHIVLQSGSNAILKRMNRKYTTRMFLETIDRIRKQKPDFTFTTDVIVGFPGETETDFEETLAILRKVLFAKVHMFPYSPREKTRAASYPHRVSPEVVSDRKRRVLELAEETGFFLRQNFLGKTDTVLLEGEEGEEGEFFGHTEGFLPVFVKGGNLGANQIVSVRLIDNTPKGLLGELL